MVSNSNVWSILSTAIFVSHYALMVSAWPSFNFHSECFPNVPQKCDKNYIQSRNDTILPDSSTLRFFLFTKKSSKTPEMLHLCHGTLPRNSRFNPNKKLVVVIPGYLFGLCEMEIYNKLKDEILKLEDVNVMLVDTREEFGLNYISAVYYLSDVAKKIANVLKNMEDQAGLKGKNVHLIAQSLGAHAAGQVANYFPIHRITGLDPAGPLFPPDFPKNLKLDSSDANIVDVIHCDAGEFGIAYPIGHADFYVNGGKDQPHCSLRHIDTRMKSNLWLALSTSVWPSACYHYQCLEYFVDTIATPGDKSWTGRHCSSYGEFQNGTCPETAPSAVMGYHFGKYYSSKQPSQTFYIDL